MTKQSFYSFIIFTVVCFYGESELKAAEPEGAQSKSIGYYTSGCIKNATALPADGVGYQVIRLSRERFYGHPDLIEYIQTLSKAVADHLGGILLIGDLAQEEGGRMPGDHSSHQIGLDADILFWQHPITTKRTLTHSEREEIHPVSLLTPDNASIDDSRWNLVHGEILKLAASSEEVERIFVNPLIKKKLCETYPGEEWLRKIRPWWGHDGHFHVRLRCPGDSPLCESQESVSVGDGCGSDLEQWLTGEMTKDSIPRVPRPLPKECLSILSE